MYQKAAELGNVSAQFNLGLHHNNRIGVEKNAEKALNGFQTRTY